MRRTSTVSFALLAAALAGVAFYKLACRERQTTTSYGFTSIDSGGGGNIEINGVPFEVDSSVHFEYFSEARNPGESSMRATVDGHDFGLRDGKVFVGEREYGPAGPGTTVRITSAGVTVGGEMRGPLPPAREK